MITIKRNCSSSIHDNPLKDKITFGDFTIVISEEDYKAFDILRVIFALKPDELLQEVILAGIDRMIEKCKDPVVE